MTQGTVTITRPEEACVEFGKLAAKRRQLVEKEASLIVTGEMAHNRGESEKETHIARDLAALRAELAGVQGDYPILEIAAKEGARERLLADSGYRRLVGAAADALAERLAPWVQLDAVTHEAAEHGVKVAPLPGGVLIELAEGRRWLARQVAAGVLDAASLPAPLTALLGEGVLRG